MKKRLLVVENDIAVANSLRRLLESEDFTVFVATDAAQAVDCFQAQPIDLVVLDINLGEDNGWTVFQQMQEIKPAVPTVIVTAEWGQRERAVATRAEALIEKPIDVSSFLSVIQNLLETTAEKPLDRDRSECHYIARDHGTFLRLVEERHSAPFQISSQVATALPSAPRSAPRLGGRKQTVVADPTTTNA